MFGSKKILFTIFSTKRLNIYQGSPKLDLIVHSVDDLESWKASFLRAGVYPEVSIDSRGGCPGRKKIVTRNSTGRFF